MKCPAVYIITLNWNGLDDTLDCLETVGGLTYPNVKVIVVDNDSGGDQAGVIERKFPDTLVLRQKENLGFCGGCNVGIRYALEKEADYVMLLNNDALVPPNLIEKLLCEIGSLGSVGAVSPLIRGYPDTDSVWFADAHWDRETASFISRKKNESVDDLAKTSPYPTDFACGCCMLVPSQVFARFGLLDERYFAFFDEAEWCERIRRHGLESYMAPAAFIYHKGSGSSCGMISTYLITRNRLLWMKEYLRFTERLRSLPYLAKELVWHIANLAGLSGGKHYSKQHSRVVLKGYGDYFRKKFYKWDAAAEKLIFDRSER
jgi:GT2 family glycosyltransferase